MILEPLNPTIDIHIVTWNSLSFIPSCLQGIFDQECTEFHVTVIDNASEDGTVNYIQSHYPQVSILRNSQNLGFSKPHNLAIQRSQSEFILILNPDVYLDKGFLTACLKTMQQDDMIGATAPRMYQINKEEFLSHAFPVDLVIDSSGLNMLKSRRIVLRGRDKKDGPEFDIPEEVFGADGAAPFYRRKMLEDISIEQEYFDEDFFAYKEDHDLAWRARLMGWKTVYVPDAKAYHIRAVRPGERGEMKGELRILGVRNRYLMMKKNELPSLTVRHLINILFYEMKILFYILLIERESWRAYLDAWRLYPRMAVKRSQIMARRRTSTKDLSIWFK
jgi:GT2 family glycosyltransferase